ncbi:MAG: imidazole glycerol phosphate synthase subunit HisH [Bacteroidia bacterium]|nr:imidazole glycerol phosphate synthase subunit HisH [Bacteroidia bacterium]NND24624.1 imidazole glycerol phosphate synthase subunit HisH [Flavobacteriaceae bacterium]MBT8279850.1 imidazole glycerol phosphate synthase subunit HisH [Bacteroidia bacterium]NNK59617.1 imidazole glycerol phosphate synthase subunit HisH [Flavobacteriaceae bacterium]NNL33457.1 imidazole glycerol phosphate synthase subunit HisH [Flavobacteriaceae bacterium]
MIAIIDYNAGNISSVRNALDRLGYESIITRDKDEIIVADKVILPGVGEASSAMHYLNEYNLTELIKGLGTPILGICLGMQLMCNYTEEGGIQCLGIFDTKVKMFPPEEKVPHMGWNNLVNLKGELFEGIKDNNDVYFVHSYFAELCPYTSAECDYILPFSAGLQKNNFYATQFHPEKSADIGEQILKNFLEL